MGNKESQTTSSLAYSYFAVASAIRRASAPPPSTIRFRLGRSVRAGDAVSENVNKLRKNKSNSERKVKFHTWVNIEEWHYE